MVTIIDMEASRPATAMSIHQIPVGGGEPLHWAHGSCWCYPLQNFCDEVQANYTTHNAQDCREVFERQGLHDSARPWMTVLGYAGTPVDASGVEMAT